TFSLTPFPVPYFPRCSPGTPSHRLPRTWGRRRRDSREAVRSGAGSTEATRPGILLLRSFEAPAWVPAPCTGSAQVGVGASAFSALWRLGTTMKVSGPLLIVAGTARI